MTVGMSAPPIGMISSTPKASASTMMTGNRNDHSTGFRIDADHRTATATPSSRKLIWFWNG